MVSDSSLYLGRSAWNFLPQSLILPSQALEFSGILIDSALLIRAWRTSWAVNWSPINAPAIRFRVNSRLCRQKSEQFRHPAPRAEDSLLVVQTDVVVGWQTFTVQRPLIVAPSCHDNGMFDYAALC